MPAEKILKVEDERSVMHFMKSGEMECSKSLTRQVLLNQLQQNLLGHSEMPHKLKLITQGMVDIFGADFCRIWLIAPGDLCELGCMYAAAREGPSVCKNKVKCLRLIASSGRYTHTNGAVHRRIPLGVYKIGRIATEKERMLFGNVAGNPDISNHDWARKLGIVSFAGFQLRSSGGESLGVLALFSAHAITPDEQVQMDALSATATQVILAAQAEAALLQSEERFRLIAETIDDVFWMSDVETERMLYINPAFERVWGRSRQKMYEDYGAFRESLHPDDCERTMEELKIKGARQPYDHEYRIIRPDGSVRHIWDRGFPIEDANGNVRNYVGVARDVTLWKNAEKTLKETKDYLSEIINCIADPVFVKDRRLRFVHVNDAMCALISRKRDDTLGKTVYEWLPKKQADFISEQENSVFESGKACIVEEEVSIKHGEKRTVMTRKALLTNKSGEKQIVGVIRDITEMRRSEELRQQMQIQLQQGQKLETIGQLAAGIAHEINTPTQYIGDNTRFLQDAFTDLTNALKQHDRLLQASRKGNVDPSLVAEIETAIAETDLAYLAEEVPKAISQSLEGLSRITTIVSAMKEFSHPDNDEKQPVDLNHAIQNTLTVCRNEWKYVAETVLDFDNTLPLVSCLPGVINQVILNLIVNASHAIADATNRGQRGKGSIDIKTRREGNWAKILISDTGTGIPEKNRAKIFTPFFTTKEVGKGTGQGLAICHSAIVGKHGGTIEFESEVGKGTTFIVSLPLAPSLKNNNATDYTD
jgi:two-component system, NtrC family, sensor kinase